MIPKYNTSLKDIGKITTWNGTSWNNGVPNKNMVVIITGVYNTGTHGNISCLDLFLNSGSLTITINTIVKVFRNIQQQAGFVFNITNGELALLNKDVDTSSVKITISRALEYTMQRLDYRLLGDPIGNKTVKTLSPGTLDNRFYQLDSTNGSLVDVPLSINVITLGTDVSKTIYKPGMGFLIRTVSNFSLSPAIWTVSTSNLTNSGKLNSGIIKINFDKNTINSDVTYLIVSNPYSVSIDIKKFLKVNSFINNRFFNYLKTNASPGTSNFVFNIFNSSILFSYFPSKIKPFEAFYLEIPKEVPEDTEIIFTPDMMIVEEPFDLLSNFKLTLKQSGWNLPVSNNCFVLYKHPVKLYDNQNLTINSTSNRMLFNYNNKTTTMVNTYEDLKEIELLVGGTSSNLTITLEEVTGVYNDYSITLVDTELNINHDLKSAPYTFASNLVIYTNRFKLLIQ